MIRAGIVAVGGDLGTGGYSTVPVSGIGAANEFGGGGALVEVAGA
ncbi:hypothetical protein [Actinophytocola xinjiangensis]|nr:hypothetical protein [Actinophytocola xinjiangensis]